MTYLMNRDTALSGDVGLSAVGVPRFYNPITLADDASGSWQLNADKGIVFVVSSSSKNAVAILAHSGLNMDEIYVGSDVFVGDITDPGNVTHEQTLTAESDQLAATSLTVSGIGGGDSQLYVAAVAIYGTDITVDSITGGGLTWTLQKSQRSGRIGQPRTEIWQAFGSPASSFNVAVTLTAEADLVSTAVSRYSGADITTPTEGAAGSNTNGQNGGNGGGTDSEFTSLELTSSRDESVFYVATHPRGKIISTPDPDYTLRAQVDNHDGGAGANLFIHGRKLLVAGTDTCDHTLNSDTDWIMAGLVINPNPGGPPAVDGKVNIWVDPEGTVNIHNRLGQEATFGIVSIGA